MSDDTDRATVRVSGCGCVTLVALVMLALVLTSDRFWAGVALLLGACR